MSWADMTVYLTHQPSTWAEQVFSECWGFPLSLPSDGSNGVFLHILLLARYLSRLFCQEKDPVFGGNKSVWKDPRGVSIYRCIRCVLHNLPSTWTLERMLPSRVGQFHGPDKEYLGPLTLRNFLGAFG